MAGSITNTYVTVMLGPGSVALKICQPAACARTAGSVEFASASFTRPMTVSKSMTRSGRTAVRSRPAFVVKERANSGTAGTGGMSGVGTGGAPGTGACGAGCATGGTGGAGDGCWVVGVTGEGTCA